MAIDWHDFLILARWLRDNTPPGMTEEAARRTGVSRAYYSAFGHARNYATAYLDFQPRENADDHGRLRAHLKQKRRRATSESLDRLRAWRNDCDYLDEVSGDLLETLDFALKDAEYVFASLPPPRPT